MNLKLNSFLSSIQLPHLFKMCKYYHIIILTIITNVSLIYYLAHSISQNDNIEPSENKIGYDVEVVADQNGHILTDDEHPLPTNEELSTLRKIPDSIPMSAYALCLVEFAERASYYGVQNVFSNFMEYPLPKGISPYNPSSNDIIDTN